MLLPFVLPSKGETREVIIMDYQKLALVILIFLVCAALIVSLGEIFKKRK